MSKVELSLQEYDELKEQIALYKAVYDAVTTPTISEWEVNHIKNEHKYTKYITTGDILKKLSISQRESLMSDIEVNVRSSLVDKGFYGVKLDVTFNGGVTATICEVKAPEVGENPEEGTDGVEEL